MRPDYPPVKRFPETLNIREDPRILKLVDGIARKRGTDRTALYREAMRYWLEKKENVDLDKILASRDLVSIKEELSRFSNKNETAAKSGKEPSL